MATATSPCRRIAGGEPAPDRRGQPLNDGESMSKSQRSTMPPTSLHVADNHDLIRVQGARVNNLKDVSVEIPKRRLTVFTGVSGSGKSSLVFGTIAGRVAAADQRDLQRLRAGFHADVVSPRGRPARRPDDGDHRRPGADGLQPAIDGRHRNRCQRHAAHPLQPARQAAHRLAQRVLVQRPVGDRRAVRSPSNAGPARRRRRRPASPGSAACVRGAKAWARSTTSI